MKSEKRQIYHRLLDLTEQGFGLCNICRYAIWYGDCKEAELECHCGIEKIEEDCYDVWGGGDCWVFRPRWSLVDITDMVGIWLQGGNPDMSNCKDYMPYKVRIA